jgi:hypothetical protein
MNLVFAYNLDHAGYDFGAPVMQSVRGHMGTDAQRSDTMHSVSLTLAKGF